MGFCGIHKKQCKDVRGCYRAFHELQLLYGFEEE